MKYKFIISVVLSLGLMLMVNLSPVEAGMNDDRYDGNIFALYAGNGSLVPPKSSLENSLKSNRVAIVLFYLDDSRDSKAFAPVYSQLQLAYGRAASLIPVLVDSLSPDQTFEASDPGYYYGGQIPQVVIFNQAGEVVFNETGQIAYEAMDDVLRNTFELLPRSETGQILQRRSFNEFNSELTFE